MPETTGNGEGRDPSSLGGLEGQPWESFVQSAIDPLQSHSSLVRKHAVRTAVKQQKADIK